MTSNLVFQEDQELGRLSIQSHMLWSYEQPVISRLLGGKGGARVLDVGCNDGEKTARWFSGPGFEKVIGLEYLDDMARLAQKKHGSEKLHFYHMDVEAEDFHQNLKRVMEEENIEAFDLIYLSFVLLHLEKPEALLAHLRTLLAPGGHIVIMDTNDRTTSMEGPENRLVEEFIEMLDRDPYGGVRDNADRLMPILQESGYRNVKLEVDCLRAEEDETERKECLFETFFSYLPEDTAMLRREEPGEEEYVRWERWLEKHFQTLRSAYIQGKGAVTMGCCLLTAER